MKQFFGRITSVAIASVMTLMALWSCEKDPVEQGGNEPDYVRIECDTLYIDSEGGVESLFVDSHNLMWDFSYDETQEWCLVYDKINDFGGRELVVDATKNDNDSSRELSVVVTNGDAADNLVVVQLANDVQAATSIECASEIVVERAMGNVEVEVNANGDYEVEISKDAASWLSYDKGVLYYGTHYGDEPRTATVTFRSAYASAEMNVMQVGKLDARLNRTLFTVYYKSGSTTIPVEVWNKNAKVSVSEDAEWLTYNAEASTNDSLKFDFAANESGAERETEVKITVGETQLTATVRQNPVAEYAEVRTDKQKADWMLAVASSEASSKFTNSRGANKTYDGNDLSWWGTYTLAQNDECWLKYEFAEEQTLTQIDYMRYAPSESITWGHWGEIEVYITRDGVESLLGKYDFGKALTPSVIYFDEPLAVEGLEKLTVKILSAIPFSETVTCVASAGEFGLYQYNPDNFQILDYFTDLSCWELRSDVTWEDIQAIADPFYRNMAEQIFNGDYNRFRRHLAQAYRHPDKDAEIFQNSPKTLLDGVTGMFVAKVSDPQIIFLDEDYGQDIFLRVIDWVNDEGMAGRVLEHERAVNYRLKKGRNVIQPANRGLMYIFWHTEDYASQPRVRINFANSCVNGYFNAETDAPEDWYPIMMQSGVSPEPHFDIITDNVIMNFTKTTLREFSFGKNPELHERAMRTIMIFDTVTRIQQIIQGFDKYAALGRERVYHNRAPFYAAYGDCFGGAGAYATVYGNRNMAHDILNPDHMWPENFDPAKLDNGKVGHCWGLAHELGHNNQTGHFGWRGLGEVSNNLMGAITQTTFFGEGNTTMRFNNHFNRAMRDMVTRWVVDPDGTERHLTYCESVNTPQYGVKRASDDPNHQPMVDPTTQLVPFWQLYLYYHRVLGKTDFYPDFYELCRLDTPILFKDWFLNGGMESSAQQEYAMYEFMVKTSKAAGEDLSGFCNDWHLPGINNRMLCSHYGQSIITTTQEEIDKRVKICNQYPKPEMNPLYINDLNLDLYRNRTPLTVGTYTVDDNMKMYFMNSDWSGVAAWALVDPETERVMGIYQGVDDYINYRYYTSVYEAFDPEKHSYRGQGCPEDSPYLTYNNGYQRYMEIGPGVFRNDLVLYGIDVWGNYHKGVRVEE
ncbi:MAG: M60 family metallopeptidase [Rikenellaceae bacterium]|nr:M60 family metallopeptidase [Rikenellaceae bacterium]